MVIDGRSDAELVAAAAAGQQAAWNELVERYSDLMYRNSRAVGAEHSLAEDMVQLGWIKLLNRIDTLAEPGRVKGWLAIVVRNATRSELRRARRRDIGLDAIFGEATDDDPVADAERLLVMRALRSGFDELSDFCQDLLAMKFFDDLQHVEIADVIDTPLGTISKRVRDCLGSLRGFVEAGTP